VRFFKVPRSTAYGWLEWFESLPEGLREGILAFMEGERILKDLIYECQQSLEGIELVQAHDDRDVFTRANRLTPARRGRLRASPPRRAGRPSGGDRARRVHPE
jgi:hypothetical protein